ncbi:hypothetical protein CLV33_1192 [Jejuia pallidilutea]|uniref:Uncharacterized protein n=1 Tax=Jejuia pallidilutea TaxID=504487 RepID=A0A362WXF5_9FLAO|nr:hypothetical protein [Jejuia pallidilutea]PQV44592.1 hypothetical protein CLV33_1192 [Jejuia pallidilutea]
MKKLLLSLVFVLFTLGISINATENNNYLSYQDTVEYDDTQTPCALYAEFMGLEFERNDLNYWNGYFGGYAKYIGILYN